jgi:hypothetical protein
MWMEGCLQQMLAEHMSADSRMGRCAWVASSSRLRWGTCTRSVAPLATLSITRSAATDALTTRHYLSTLSVWLTHAYNTRRTHACRLGCMHSPPIGVPRMSSPTSPLHLPQVYASNAKPNRITVTIRYGSLSSRCSNGSTAGGADLTEHDPYPYPAAAATVKRR